MSSTEYCSVLDGRIKHNPDTLNAMQGQIQPTGKHLTHFLNKTGSKVAIVFCSQALQLLLGLIYDVYKWLAFYLLYNNH